MSDLKKAKRDLLKVIEKHELGFWQLANLMKDVRRDAEAKFDFFKFPKKEKRLPVMPSVDQVRKFIKQFNSMQNPQYKLWALLTYTTGMRVSEMVNILIRDVNLTEKKILIHGKGKKDRYILILPELAEMIRFHLKNSGNEIFLFENGKKPYTARTVQYAFERARKLAGIKIRMSPHIARHVFLTALTDEGWNEAEIMKLSGHSDKNSLAIYQHLAVDGLREKFNGSAGGQLRKILE